MSNDEKEILKEKIKRAIKISSQKLIEKKKSSWTKACNKLRWEN